MMSDKMMTGVIKRLVRDKGFGFIRGEDNLERFFHQSSCQVDFENLKEGDHVEFVAAQGQKGPRAEDICLIT